eukprot:92625_1
MATTVPKSTPKIVSSPVTTHDEKKDEEELNIISTLDALFEEYRVVHELAFDIAKKEKAKQLSDIKKKIESLIERIDELYPYKQTINIKTHNAKQNGNKNKSKKRDKTNNKTTLSENTNEVNNANKIVDDHDTTNASTSVTTTATISRAHYLYFVGRYHKLCGALSVASPLLEEAIKLNPELIGCWNSLGDIYLIQSELTAATFCFESALEYDEYNKISYLSLSKILRTPRGKDEMQIMENCIESLILAKQALKYGKKWGKGKAIKDGELWFNLGNAYLMTFLNCINGWKLDSSVALEVDKEEKCRAVVGKEIAAVVSSLDDNYFSREYESDNIRKEIRREIETELNDSDNNLLYHVYIKKCLSAYKCAATKCTMNKHSHHPDLYCNRSHIHIYQEKYSEALQDLKLSIKYSVCDDNKDKCQAKLIYDELLPKLCKISKQIGNKTNHKMHKKMNGFTHSMRQYMAQCSDYYTRQLYYDLVDFKTLNEGLNGGNVIVIKCINLMKPANQLPLHFVCIDSGGSMFVLSFYLRGHALNHMYKILNQTNIINPQTLICVANPLKRCIKFTNGSKHIMFHFVSFQKPQDICIGGKFFFNQ